MRELDPSVLPEWRRTFRVAAGQMAQVRGRVECLCEGLPLKADEVFDLTLAVGEALGNAVDHAGERGVLVTVAAYADRVVVDVADCGQGFSLGRTRGCREAAADAERGRGIKLMRMLTDSASISPRARARAQLRTWSSSSLTALLPVDYFYGIYLRKRTFCRKSNYCLRGRLSFRILLLAHAGLAQLVARHLAKVEVAVRTP